MKKVYVLDTNVLLSDPNAIYAFGVSDVVLPSVVIEELDNKKKETDEIGRNARFVSRQLDELRLIGNLHKGIKLPRGGMFSVLIHDNKSSLFDTFLDNKNDNAIIAVAKTLTEYHQSLCLGDHEVILVSKDTLVRIKCDIVNVKAEDYQFDKVSVSEDDLYKGYSELIVPDHLIDLFYSDKFLESNMPLFKDYPENHMFLLKSEARLTKSAICRKVGYKLSPFFNYTKNMQVFSASHKNVEQMMALELLMDDSVPLVTLSGKAGTGKTLLALAAGLQKTLEEKLYTKILVARPVVPMGKDIGYLKGTKEEKLRPWMQPIFDNLEFLFGKTGVDLENLLAGSQNVLQVEALTYIRGRSIPKQFVIIDEAQNLSQHEVKAITTRIGEGSKIVLVGDPQQIDSPYLDLYSNGLTHLIEKMKSIKETGHITLQHGERSTLAQLCADML